MGSTCLGHGIDMPAPSTAVFAARRNPVLRVSDCLDVRCRPVADLEVNGGLAELSEEDFRRRFDQHAVNGGHCSADDRSCRVVVVAIVDADHDRRPSLSLIGEVDQRVAKDICIRQQEADAVVSPEASHAHVDVCDRALVVACDDLIVDLERLADQDQQAGDEVLQDVLERECKANPKRPNAASAAPISNPATDSATMMSTVINTMRAKVTVSFLREESRLPRPPPG